MERDIEKEADDFFATVPCKTVKISNSAVMPGSVPELGMSDDEIMEWGRKTYGDKLPERLTELRNIIDRAIAASRKARRE